MSISSTFETIADAVYEKGVAQGMNELELKLTRNYSRKNYMGAFLEADWTGYEFSQPVCPRTGVEKMFYSYAGTSLPTPIDCSGLSVNESAIYYRSMFEWANKLEEIPDIGLPAIPYYTSTYYHCTNLKKIAVIRCTKNAVFSGAFVDCVSLSEFEIEGEIGTTFDCSYSPLSVKTMISILSHLFNYKSTSNAHKYSVLFKSSCWTTLNNSTTPKKEGLTTTDMSWEEYVESIGWAY